MGGKTSEKETFGKGLPLALSRPNRPRVRRAFCESEAAGILPRDGIDWYACCGNNPLSSTDPSGLFQEQREKQIADGYGLGGVSGGTIDIGSILAGILGAVMGTHGADSATEAPNGDGIDAVSGADPGTSVSGDGAIGPPINPGNVTAAPADPLRPEGIPDEWIAKPTKGIGGMMYSDPENPSGNWVRSMPGNPESPWPAQRGPYVKRFIDGKPVDIKGNPLRSPDLPEAHIPFNSFRF